MCIRDRSRPAFYWEFHEGGFSQGLILDERWKAIRLKRLDAPIQIFDLEIDPGEKEDIASSRAELVERARGLFESERTESPAWPIKEAPVKGAQNDSAEK